MGTALLRISDGILARILRHLVFTELANLQGTSNKKNENFLTFDGEAEQRL